MGIFLLWATWAHEYKAIFVLMGIARRGVLKDRCGSSAVIWKHDS